jgi:uncharacterized glyoxalase superfamily protein PhnB
LFRSREDWHYKTVGFTVADVEAFYRDMSAKGVLFSMPPKKQDFGGVLAQFVDSEGAHCRVGAQAHSSRSRELAKSGATL